eukprot:12408440-Karenia_brevis.AAC.1
MVPVGDGKQIIHIMSVYGYGGASHNSDDMAKNEELLRAVLCSAMELGNVPVVIAGDLNVDPQRSAALCSALASRRWVDAELASSSFSGRPPRPTCFSGSSPTRIDIILCNDIFASSLRGVRVVDETGLPTHMPVAALCDFAHFSDQVWRMRRPAEFQVKAWAKWKKGDEECLASDIFEYFIKEWFEALETSSVDELWKLWCQMAETYLLERSGFLSHARKLKGRGRVPLPCLGFAAEKQRQQEVGAQTTTMRRQLKLLRRCEELQRQRNRLIAMPGRGQLPYNLQKLWDNIRRDALTQKVLGDSTDVWHQSTPPSRECMDEVIFRLRRAAESMSSASRRDRVQAWKTWMNEMWTTRCGE